jgi:hypothetical protein
MKLLVFFLLRWFHQKHDNKRYFSRKKILKTPIFLDQFPEVRFHLLLKFIHFVGKTYSETACSSEDYVY